MASVADIITAYRIKVYDHAPYLAPYVYSLTPVERPGLGTMAVDKYGRMYYDPAFCEGLTVEQGAYVVLHESWHLILRHCHRAEKIIGPSPSAREQFLYNVAVDLVVWEMMVAIKGDSPVGGITLPLMQAKYPAIVPNMTVEAIYSVIMEQENKPKPSDDVHADDFGHKPEPEDAPEDQSEDDGGDRPTDRVVKGDGDGEKQTGESNDDNDGGEGDDAGKPDDGGSQDGEESSGKGGIQPEDVKLTGGGSGADGLPRDYEEEPDSNWEGFMEDNLLEAIEQKVQELEDSGWVGGRGTIPAGLKRVLKEKLHPSTNPWDRLRSVVGHAAAANRGTPQATYQRPSRRSAGMDVRLKGSKPYMPKAVVIVDTSGSMTRECLAKAIVVIKQGLRAMPSVRVITCDARVSSDLVLTAAHKDFELVGGGGTDMRVPIDYAQRKYHPDVTVLVTDCDTPWPAEKIRGQLIVAATQDGRVPDWATMVRIPDRGEEGFNG